MKIRIDSQDTALVARLKLLYLVPGWVLLVIPTALVAGLQETKWGGAADIWYVLKNGHHPDRRPR